MMNPRNMIAKHVRRVRRQKPGINWRREKRMARRTFTRGFLALCEGINELANWADWWIEEVTLDEKP